MGSRTASRDRAGCPEDEPSWVAYFDEAEFNAQVGTCYLDLKGPRVAHDYFDKALAGLPGSKVRDRATYLTRAAAAQLALGDLDWACATAAEAIPLIQQAPSQRNLERVRAVRRRMPVARSDRRVRELDEQLSTLGA